MGREVSDYYTDLYIDDPLAEGFVVEIDWDRDGDFFTWYDNVTPDVQRQDQVSLQYGRDPGGAIFVAGSGGFTLDNSSRRYSSRNTASPLYGKIKPARPVRVTRTAGGFPYTVFHGHTDETPLNPDVSARTVSVALTDYLADFRGQEISTTVHRGIRTGEAIGFVLDACGWSATARDLDAGATVIPWWWEDKTDALTALEKIMRSEGAPSMLTIGAGGEIIFRDRHHRLIRSTSSTSQDTWRNAGTVGRVMARGFSYDDAWGNIINTGSVQVDQRTAGETQVVWTNETSFRLAASASTSFAITTTDPVIDMVVPSLVNGDITKPTGLVGGVTATLNQTSGQTFFLTLTANAFGCWVDTLQLRGKPLTVTSTSTVSASDSGSIADYGSRSFQDDLPWCNAYDAQGILNKVVADRADPLPVVTTRFVVGRNTRHYPLLARDLSDRVTVIEPESALNDAFYIEQIHHDFTGEDDHEMTFTLEHVPPSPGTPFVLGSSLLGGSAVLLP